MIVETSIFVYPLKEKNIKNLNMKNTFLLTAFVIALLITTNSNAQVGIGVSTANINPSAQLDVTSTTKGLLPPRMTEAQRNLIIVTSASAGLQIWCTNCGVYGETEVFNGYSWTNMVGGVAAAAPSATIGTQVWTTQNLNVFTYRDGTPIPKITDATAWASLTTGAYCYYDNDSATYAALYGKLYNWYAMKDSTHGGLAPTGWHVPTDAEWATLTTTLGGESVSGGKMKALGTTRWITPNTGANNISGFAGLPGGYRLFNGSFFNIGSNGVWWSSTEYLTTYAWNRGLNYNTSNASRFYNYKLGGFSVRCLMD